MIYGNAVMAPAALKTVILTDDNGNEITGVVVGEETVFTANAATDIREGKVAATSEGVVTGSKIIPSYHTTVGYRAIPADTAFDIPLPLENRYDFTELQAMIMPYNTTLADSVAVDKVIIDGSVYSAGSTRVISTVTKDSENKTISLGIVNGNTPAIIRYFTYKEES